MFISPFVCVLLHTILTVAKIVRSFVTAKEKRNYFCVAQKITIRLLSQPLAYRQTVLGW